MNNKIINVVLLGGGYASIWAYRSLLHGMGHEISFGKVRVTVVCPDEHHFFHGWTAESIGCIIQDKNRMSPLVELFPKARLIRGAADEINYAENQVHLKLQDGSEISIAYDHLLIGIGAVDSEKIDGLKDFGYQVKSHAAFLRSKHEIQSLVEQAALKNGEEAKRLLRFTVAGSGFSGVELVTNIAEFLRVLKNEFPSLRDITPLVRLVSSNSKILNELDPGLNRMRRYAERIMVQYGIEAIYNEKIIKITPEGAWLSDGRILESSMVISATGQSRISLKGTEDMKKDHLCRLRTNGYLQIQNYPNIWGGGDACSVPHCKTGKPCPSNALWAIKQGRHVGMNISRAIKDRPLKTFTYKGLGQCASLGIGKGIGELYGVEFTGWLAWITRWLFFNYFMPSRKVMFYEIMDWVHLFFLGKRKCLPEPGKFTGKVCWITGASRGIGAALARHLSKSGSYLILSARNVDDLQEVKSSCAQPEKVAILTCDMNKPDSLAGVANDAWGKFGCIDYVFLNAGMAVRDTVVDTELSMIQKVMNINFFSNTVISKALLPHFMARGSGTFVVTSSIGGKFGVPKLAAYSASKHALHGFYESLRCETESKGIKVTIITSGLVRTNITINALRGDGKPYARMHGSIANGISPTKCANGIIRAVAAGKREALVGGIEKYGVLVKRFFPGLLAWAIARHPLKRIRSLGLLKMVTSKRGENLDNNVAMDARITVS
jgi:NADH dehydrogenase